MKTSVVFTAFGDLGYNDIATWSESVIYPGKWHVLFDRVPGFPSRATDCYAVIDDFGNLVEVPQ